ncbi:hypothetical protein [Candidatus Poriferisodalis sp.]|uniref:hypothetical protein n=1 Tax=Candidatus Poriferisodalis sp. TaxID=3101277 RepID=UPI003AF5F262
MGWTSGEIEERADELADWFENEFPERAREVPVAELLLERAARARAQCEQAVADAVRSALAAGMPWSRVGAILGIDALDARRTYGPGIAGESIGIPAELEVSAEDDSGLAIDL